MFNYDIVKQMIKLPVIVESVRDKKDRSCSITFGTRELENDEFGVLRDMRGIEGQLIFSAFELQNEEIDKELDVEKEDVDRTPSKRLRSVLFVYWKQLVDKNKMTLTFNEFYRTKMESLINIIKEKLE